MQEHRRRYKNPPIEEAVCEFRFGPGQEWDPTIPGNLQHALDGQYAGKAQEQRVVAIDLETHKDKPANLKYGEGVAKIKLVTEDGKRMVGVGQDVLTVHMLRPYHDLLRSDQGGWEEFQPRISQALDAYWALVEPGGVCRIGIRYINKIVIPQETVEVEDYLKCALPRVTGLPDRRNGFISRVEYAYDDAVRLVLSQGSIQAPPEQVGFLLDLDVIWETEELVTRDEALAKVDDLRDRERTTFETVITEKARELFDAD